MPKILYAFEEVFYWNVTRSSIVQSKNNTRRIGIELRRKCERGWRRDVYASTKIYFKPFRAVGIGGSENGDFFRNTYYGIDLFEARQNNLEVPSFSMHSNSNEATDG